MKKKTVELFLLLPVIASLLLSCGKPAAKSVQRGSLIDNMESGESEVDGGIKLSDRPVDVYEGHLDTVVMIYLVGSNLESENGLATTDLQEIQAAIESAGDPEAGVKIIVETGGCCQWAGAYDIDPEKLQRFEVGKDGLVLKDELDAANMANPHTLADFMDYGFRAYPADHYDLILWDHGGGSVMGFGSDELYSGSMMRLPQLQKAFESVKGHFDFIGFDACLMATVETAYMLSPYADYMIASEEFEPGDGWYYTNWVSLLYQDPKTSAVTLGQQIIDDFAASNEESGDMYTLSMIDLKKIGEVYNALLTFAGGSNKALENQQYAALSKARSDARDFGNGNYEQVDIVDFAAKSNVDGTANLEQAVSDSVVYSRTNLMNANGLAMYYPCSYLEEYDQMEGIFRALDFDPSYTDSLSGFCTVMAQAYEETEDGGEYSDEEWYRADVEGLYKGKTNLGLPAVLTFKEVDGKQILDITPEQFDNMTYCAMEVWSDYGEGIIKLGKDDSWGLTEDGDHIVASFDGSWMSVNDTWVPYNMEEIGVKTDGTSYQYGYCNARLNGKTDIRLRVEVLAYENGENVARTCGYWVTDEMKQEGGDSVRNLRQFEKGDKIEFMASWIEDGTDEVQYGPISKKIKAWKDLKVGYGLIQSDKVVVRFELEDIYKNKYDTDYLEIANDYKDTYNEVFGG